MTGFRILIAFLLIGLTCVNGREVSSGDYEERIIHYVALGDSIAKGYGLEDAETESYVGQIATSLEAKYDAVHTINLGVNGMDSKALLDVLNNPNQDEHQSYIKEIQKADIITLSIGSNDLLKHISKTTDLAKFAQNADAILTKSCKRFSRIYPKILGRLQELAPNAQIIVNNIYNPCHDVSFSVPEFVNINISDMAEKYINKINACFLNKKSMEMCSKITNQVVFIDVKSEFDNRKQKLINSMGSWGSLDPHPNKEGHRYIAQLIIPKIKIEGKEKEP